MTIAPGHASPPSRRTLVVTTLLAAGAAAVILVAFVLPAEYGVDPLRTGRLLGLTRIARPTPAVEEPPPSAGQALAPVQKGPIGSYPAEYRTDTRQFVLGPYDFVEYKYRLQQGATLVYAWQATATVSEDFHGDPNASPDAPVSFEQQD